MSSKLSAVLALICILWLENTNARGVVHVREDDAISQVFEDYDKYAYPGTTEQPIVKVWHGLSLEKMDYVSRNYLTTDKDRLIGFDGTVFPKLCQLFVQRTSFVESNIVRVNPNTKPLFNPNVVVNRNGDVVLVPDAKYETEDCNQKNDGVIECKFKFGSWTYGADEIDLHAISPWVTLETYTDNAEYEIVGSNAGREARKYDCCPETYYDIVYTIQIKRR